MKGKFDVYVLWTFYVFVLKYTFKKNLTLKMKNWIEQPWNSTTHLSTLLSKYIEYFYRLNLSWVEITDKFLIGWNSCIESKVLKHWLSGRLSYVSNVLQCTHMSKLQRVLPRLTRILGLERTALHKIRVSGTAEEPLLMWKSPTCAYISQKLR